jgi:hypothetical protein
MKELRHRVVWLGAFFIAACGFAAQIPLHAPWTYDTPMQRRTVIITLLLILSGGAIVNIAVAWSHALMFDAVDSPKSTTFESVVPDHGVWYVDQEQQFGSTFINALYRSMEYLHDTASWDLTQIDANQAKTTVPAGIPWWVRHRESRFAPDTSRKDAWRYLGEARGFPVVAMQQEFEMRHLPDGGRFFNTDFVVHGGIPFAHGIHTPRSLPFRPIWPGFLINTLVYAALLWLIFLAPFAARRMLRRRRGLCEKCAYPVGTWGGSSVCTECGAAVRPRPND